MNTSNVLWLDTYKSLKAKYIAPPILTFIVKVLIFTWQHIAFSYAFTSDFTAGTRSQQRRSLAFSYALIPDFTAM
jgi:hypothetical protein